MQTTLSLLGHAFDGVHGELLLRGPGAGGGGYCVITATAAGTDDYTRPPPFTVTVQAAGDTLVLNLDAVAVDDTINIDEKAAGFSIGATPLRRPG